MCSGAIKAVVFRPVVLIASVRIAATEVSVTVAIWIASYSNFGRSDGLAEPTRHQA